MPLGGPAAGRLRHRVAFDVPQVADDGFGGEVRSWLEATRCRADFIYARGGEEDLASSLTGTSTFKVRLRSNEATRALTTEHQMRDLGRAVQYNIREVDALTHRRWVYLICESGVAV